VLQEELRVQVGQFNRVANRLDLSAQATDRSVIDVGDFLENEFFDLRLRNDLEDITAAWLQQQGVSGAQHPIAQRLGQADDTLLVGAADHQGALSIGEELLEHHDLADAFVFSDADDVECLVEHHFLTRAQSLGVDFRTGYDAHLPSRDGHIERTVIQPGEENAVTPRRLREAIDLGLQGHDLLAGIAQRGDESAVVRLGSGQFRLEYAQPLLSAAGHGPAVFRLVGHDHLPLTTLPTDRRPCPYEDAEDSP